MINAGIGTRLITLWTVIVPIMELYNGLALAEDFAWGKMELKPDGVLFHVTASEDSPVLSVPRFQNPVKRVFLKSDTEQKELRLKPGIKSWDIVLPAKLSGPVTVVMDTVGAPRGTQEPMVFRADVNGILTLPAHGAIVHGEKLRYEPQPHKNTVGYWQNPEDWCEWKIELEGTQRYEVFILQGCGKGHGGSEVNLFAGTKRLNFKVEDTGHFQNFQRRSLGMVALDSVTCQSLKLVPVRKSKGAVMDVRRIELVVDKD